MAENLGVIEDGVATEPSRRRSNPGWILAVAGFVMGLGLGVLVVNPAPETSSPLVTEAPGDGVAPPTTVARVEDFGIAASVDHFPDTLVAVSGTTGSTLDHLLWPLRGELRTRSMPGGSNVLLDSVARFIALSEVVPDREGMVLSIGRFNRINVVAGDVTSYVWHDEMSGLLSYTTKDEGVWRLFVVRAGFQPQLITEATELSGTLVGFGAWGWAVQTSPDEMTLLTPSGAFKAVESGVGYASHRSGWVFMVDEGPKLVSAGGGVQRVDTNLNVGDISVARFSPDGTRVAVGGARGLSVLYLRSGVAEPFGGSSVSYATWSSDSRFVVVPAGLGVVVHDIETTDRYQLLRNYRIRAVGTAPLSNS
ncbi:MAG TPA: hypothetical protein VF115_10640 [Acidimicrobiia bacterium]